LNPDETREHADEYIERKKRRKKSEWLGYGGRGRRGKGPGYIWGEEKEMLKGRTGSGSGGGKWKWK
jgi:hypothetical protein